MKRKDFFKSLAALPFVAKAIADPLKPEELSAKKAAEKAKKKGRGDFKMFNEDPKYISCSIADGYYDYNNKTIPYATTSIIVSKKNRKGKIY